MRRLLDKLTYANVTATLALFIALGGTSYAALKLPSNSVRATHITASAVRSSEIKDRSVGLRDISTTTRRQLRGQTGAPGAPGPQGPAGAPAARFFAAVSEAGTLVRGNATSGGGAGGVGSYVVGFGANTSGCAYSATLGTTDATVTAPGRVVVREEAGRVGVQKFDAAGNPAALPFHHVGAC